VLFVDLSPGRLRITVESKHGCFLSLDFCIMKSVDGLVDDRISPSELYQKFTKFHD
jgi:hypothetical protein